MEIVTHAREMAEAEGRYAEAATFDTFAENDVWTTTEESPDHSISRLIKNADECVQEWNIEDLWQTRSILMVHSLEGEFKSIFAYQVAEALATGSPLLRRWNAPAARRVGILQTEMSDLQVGKRLKQMYSDGRIPANLIVSNEWLQTQLRAKFGPDEKFKVIHRWLLDEGIDVLIWDTINSVLCSCGNPNTEEATNRFYEFLNLLPARSSLAVRHDGKPSKDSLQRAGNQKVRGSNAHVEIASAVVHLQRPDKRSCEVTLDVGKLRHGLSPAPFKCWFEQKSMRLSPVPPIVALLEERPLSREQLNAGLLDRFGIKERTADKQVAEMGTLISRSAAGHERMLELNRSANPDPDSDEGNWWSLLKTAPVKIAEPAPHPLTVCNLPELAAV